MVNKKQATGKECKGDAYNSIISFFVQQDFP